jgi:heme/copper-type cytochrome/quinol oxidase subunit 2
VKACADPGASISASVGGSNHDYKHLTSDDTDHGFRIVDSELNAVIPKRRRGETVVTFTADTAGRFVIECSRPCGAGHTAMRATLVVK